MQQTTKRWVSISYLLQCRQIQQIISRSSHKNSNKAAHLRLIEEAVEGSEKIMHYQKQVKHKKRIKLSEEFNRVVYFEGEGHLTREIVEDILQKCEVQLNKVTINWQRECCFVEVEHVKAIDMPPLLEIIRQVCQQMGVKILAWPQIKQAQIQYESILEQCGEQPRLKTKKIKKGKVMVPRTELNTMSKFTLA